MAKQAIQIQEAVILGENDCGYLFCVGRVGSVWEIIPIHAAARLILKRCLMKSATLMEDFLDIAFAITHMTQYVKGFGLATRTNLL